MTKKIGTSTIIKEIDPHIGIRKILICRPNHRLGNLLLITPLIEEITATFPDCTIDVFVKGGIGTTLFKNHENVQTIIQLPRKPFKYPIQYLLGCIAVKRKRYDLVINAVHGSASGKLITAFITAKHKIFGEVDEEVQSYCKDYMHMAKSPVYAFRNYISTSKYANNLLEIPTLHLKLNAIEVEEGYQILKKIIPDETKQTICIFTNATGEKCYSEVWWKDFYHKLKKSNSAYQIIEILPIENISKIDFKAPTYYSKNLRHIGALIANTSLFIGADSGVMHLACATQTPTIGLFSVTDPRRYAPYGLYNFGIQTNTKTTDQCIEIIQHVLNTTHYAIEKQYAIS